MSRNQKTIYLIRHGEIQTEDKRCIGTTEVPLSERGRLQARRIGMWITRQVKRNHSPYRLYSSPLTRCIETAETMMSAAALSDRDIEIRQDLHEIMMGEWDNLSFREIRERYPQEYEKRGQNFWEYRTPGGESFEDVGKRSIACLKKIAQESHLGEREQVCFVVVHAGVIRSVLAYLGVIDTEMVMDFKIPYGSVTKLVSTIDPGGIRFDPEYYGYEPTLVPDNTQITEILDRFMVPDHIRRHMKGVANVLLDIADMLDPDCEIYDRELLYAAAMLHDFAKLHKNLGSHGTLMLSNEGYELVADLIREHESVELHQELAVFKNGRYNISEEDLLYYADKRVLEDVVVPLNERFEASLKKCRTPDARMNHMRRWNKAIKIENDVFRYYEHHPDLKQSIQQE